MGRSARSQAQNPLGSQQEKNSLLPTPKGLQSSRTTTLRATRSCNLGAQPLLGFFKNLAKRCGLFISCEIQTTLSTILRKWIDVK